MVFRKFLGFVIAIIFLVTNLYANYTVIYGNYSDKIGLKYVSKKGTPSALLVKVKDSFVNNAIVFTRVYNSRLQFGIRYSKNSFNQYSTKTFLLIYDLSAKKVMEYKNFGKLKYSGDVLYMDATKSYNGRYKAIVAIYDKDDNAIQLNAKENFTIKKSSNIIPPKLNLVSEYPHTINLGKQITFQATLSKSISSEYIVQVDYGNGYKSMNCNNKNCSISVYPTKVGTEMFYTIRIVDKNGNLKDSDGGTYTVTKATKLPSIDSLNKTTFEATNSTQDLRIYGSNFDSNTRVYIDYGSGYKKQSTSYTHLISSSEIKFDLRTTLSGSGTWKVKVKNSDGYSNYKRFTVNKAPVAKPKITSIEPAQLVAKNEYQNIYLNGSNFKSSNSVQWDNQGEYGEINSNNGFHFISSNKIRLYMQTTTGGTGTWKFRVRDGNNYSNWYSVEAKQKIPKPTKPTLKSPLNNAQLTGTTQTLRWNSSTNANGYEIYLRDETTNNWIYSDSGEKKVTGTSITYNNFIKGHSYVWNLKAYNNSGHSSLSETRRFTIKNDVTEKAPTFNTSFSIKDNYITSRLIYIKKYADKYYFDYHIYKKGDRSNPLQPVGKKTLLGGSWVDWNFSVDNLPKGDYEVVYGVYSSSDSNLLLTTITKKFSVVKESDTQKPIVTILEPENLNVSHTGNILKIYVEVKDNVGLKKLYVVSDGKKLPPIDLNPNSKDMQDYLTIDISSVKEGQRTVTVQAEDTSSNKSDIKTYHYTRGSNTPLTDNIGINFVSTSPENKKVNDTVTFIANTTKDIDSQYLAYVVIDGDSRKHKMSCNYKRCEYSQVIKSPGINRKYTITIEKDNKVVSTKVGYYNIYSRNYSYQVEHFWISDSKKYYAEDNPNFDAQFKITNTGNEKVVLDKLSIAILDTNNNFIQDCWIKDSQTTIDIGKSFDSGLKSCKLPSRGDYKAVLKIYENNQWKEFYKQRFHLKGKIEDNQKPKIMNIYTSSTSLKIGQEFTLNIEVADPDGVIKTIDVDWNDGSVVSSKHPNKKSAKVFFKHTFNHYGTYAWTATAYDNWLDKDNTPEKKYSKSVMKKGYVVIHDPEFYMTPILISANYNGIIKADGKIRYITLKGNNFSRDSKVHWKTPAGKGYYKSINRVSKSEIKVPIKPNANEAGTWEFYVENNGKRSSIKRLKVEKVEKVEIFNTSKLNTIKVISGTKVNSRFKAKGGSNLKICYEYYTDTDKISTYKNRGCKSAKSGEATFTFYPTTKRDIAKDTITFWAKNDYQESNKVYVNIQVYNSSNYHYELDNSSAKKAGQCGGRYVIKKNNSVNTASGAETFSLNLMQVKGLNTVSAILSYNSLLLTDNDISRGWNHNYGLSANLEFLDENKNNIRLNWNNGRYNDFTLTSQNTYTSDDTPTKFSKIIHNQDGTYTLKLPNKVVYNFYDSGFIKSVENQLGQGIIISYDNNGTLYRVSDKTSGVALEYKYNDKGKLSKIIDPQLNRETLLEYNEKGYLSHIIAPENIEYFFDYNEIGQMTQFTYGDGTIHFKNTYQKNGLIATEDDGRDDNHIFEYSFDKSQKGFIKSTYIDGNGQETKYLYDSKDFLLYKIEDALGNTIVNEYDQTTRQLIKTTNQKGQSTLFKYDNNGNLIEKILPNGLKTLYKYDSNRNITEEKIVLKDGSSLITKYVYNSDNTLKSKTLPNSDTTTYEYNTNKQIIKTTTPSGAVTKYSYTNGRLSKVIYPKGNYVTYEYDEAGRLISETAMPINATTRYEYDNADRLIQVTDPLNHSIFYSYDMRGNKILTIDAKGNQTKYEYNSKNMLTKIIYPDNTETTYEYDGEDRVKTITYANGATNKFEYDPLGRVVKQIDAMGNFITFTYDALGNVLQKFDTNGNLIAKYKYDAMQNVVEAVDYFNNKTTNSYNQLGLLEQTTDPLGRVNKFKYDKLGRLTQAIDALNGISTKSYDKNGDTKEFTDPNNNKTILKHDIAGNLTQITTASKSTTKYEYDASGFLIKEINGRGQERKYSYNKNGQITKIVDNAGTIEYEYDANGNTISIKENGKTISMVYDTMNRVTDYTDANGNHIGYEYDSVGNLKTLIYPDGKRVSYAYNKANQLIKVTDWNNHITTYEYDNNGRLIKQTYPNGVVLTRTYDNGGRLISQKEFKGNNRISEFAYEYDKVGNILKERSYPQISPKKLASIQMSYAKGNLLKEANGTTPKFDADDNMIEYGFLKLTYDSRNRLIKANNTSYSYDANNNRLSQTTNGKTTSYIVNPNAPLSQLLVKTDANGKKTYYVYGLGLISQTKDKKTLYYHFDLRGSTIALTNDDKKFTAISDRFFYSPYGKVVEHSGSTFIPFLFVGKHGVMKEPNNLYYMRARYYHETLRRFVNRDTLLGEVGDFGSLNRFGYVDGLVSGSIDPLGLATSNDYRITRGYINYYISISNNRTEAWQYSRQDRNKYPKDFRLAAAEHFLYAYKEVKEGDWKQFYLMRTAIFGYTPIKYLDQHTCNVLGTRSPASQFEIGFGLAGAFYGYTNSWSISITNRNSPQVINGKKER